LNPYVRITDSEDTEIVRVRISEGKVGSIGSSAASRQVWVSVSNLPSRYKIYGGYEFYYDKSHRERAGGPFEVELPSLK